jgi:hypothetical protein
MLNRSFIQLILVQFRDFYREPATLFWSLLFPILMAWGLGIAFNKRPEFTKTIAVVLEGQPIESLMPIIQKANPTIQSDSLSNTTYIQINCGNENTGLTHFKLKPVNWNEAELMIKRGNT